MRSVIIGLIIGVIVWFITKSTATTLLIGFIVLIAFFIGSRLLNPINIMARIMVKEAQRITKIVLEKLNKQTYDTEKLNKVFCEIIGIKNGELQPKLKDELKKSNICLEGLCYGIGLNFSKFPSGSMVFRCVQFINLIDKELYNYGIEPCSLEMKIDLFKAFNLYEAYEHDPKPFDLTKNKSTKTSNENNLLKKEKMDTVDEKLEYINNREKKTLNIKKRNIFPPYDIDVIEIYDKLMNTEKLTFETIWNKFPNVQCFNDVMCLETIELIQTGAYTAYISHYTDQNGRDYLTNFSFLPNKVIDYFIFQLLLEYISGEFYYRRLITDKEKIRIYKNKLHQLDQEKYLAFYYGQYPYSFEKEDIPYIQAFVTDVSGEVLFIEACLTQGKKYNIVNTEIIESYTILF